MLFGATLFAVAFGASGFFLYRMARARFGSRAAADMVSGSHLRALGILSVAYLAARSHGAFDPHLLESVLLFGLTGGQVASFVIRRRASRRAGGPLLVPDRAHVRIATRLLAGICAFGAVVTGGSMILSGVVTVNKVAVLSVLAMSTVTVLQASQGLPVLFEGGVLRRYGFLPWSRVHACRWIEYQDTAELQLVLTRPWWFRNEITVLIPKGNLPTLHAWLGSRLPCLGTQRQLTPKAYRPA